MRRKPIDPKKLDKFVKILREGGVVMCNAKTLAQLKACAGPLSAAVWDNANVRVSPHLRDGQLMALTHDFTAGNNATALTATPEEPQTDG
jgi:hypothetical protein